MANNELRFPFKIAIPLVTAIMVVIFVVAATTPPYKPSIADKAALSANYIFKGVWVIDQASSGNYEVKGSVLLIRFFNGTNINATPDYLQISENYTYSGFFVLLKSGERSIRIIMMNLTEAGVKYYNETVRSQKPSHFSKGEFIYNENTVIVFTTDKRAIVIKFEGFKPETLQISRFLEEFV